MMKKIIDSLTLFIYLIFFFKGDEEFPTYKEKFYLILTILLEKIEVKRKVKLGDIKFNMVDDTEFNKTKDEKDLKIKFVNVFDINFKEVGWDDEQKNIYDLIKKGGFDDSGKYGYIRISRDNICIDGQHRLVSLKDNFDNDYELIVKKNCIIKWEFFIKVTLKSLRKVILDNKIIESKGGIDIENYGLIYYWNIMFPNDEIK